MLIVVCWSSSRMRLRPVLLIHLTACSVFMWIIMARDSAYPLEFVLRRLQLQLYLQLRNRVLRLQQALRELAIGSLQALSLAVLYDVGPRFSSALLDHLGRLFQSCFKIRNPLTKSFVLVLQFLVRGAHYSYSM